MSKFLLSATLTVVLMGCRGTQDESPGIPSPVDPIRNPVAFAVANASPEQLPPLADGVVTADEYEASVLNTVQCMTEQGISMAEAPHWDKETGSRMSFSFHGSTTIEDSQKQNAIYEGCRLRFMAAIEHVWLVQHLPSEKKLQEAEDALRICLKASGLEVPAGLPSDELTDAFSNDEAFWTCAKKVEVEYQIPGFVG